MTKIRRDDLKLVPLIVGHPSGNNSEKVVSALEKYWKDSETFFIISSDFCHW
jgi:AmmeMemoRadiSam system protein B